MLDILNKKEMEQKLKYLETRFGIPLEKFMPYAFMVNEKQDKMFITSRECLMEELRHIRVDTIGLLFARPGNFPEEWKLTTNVVQLFGKYADKNILYLTEQQKPDFIRGIDLQLTDEQIKKVADGYVIVKHAEDIFGVALVQGNRLKNQIPKSRRIKKL